MSLSGPDALRSLDEALRDIRREEDEIARRLARSAEMVAKIRESEGELLRQLAAVRLDPATQAELSGRLSQAEARARDMLKKHSSELGTAEDRLKALDRQIAALGAERSDKVADEQRREAELKAIAESLAGTLATDSAYAEKRAAADELAGIAEESIRKTTQAEADREDKGKPYRDDPLFMYLWERKFGTRDYRAGNITRWLDGIVAGLVRYPEARPNYAMLNEIPMRLREHAERQQQAAEAAHAAVVALETAAVDAAGGKPARQALAVAVERIAAIDAELVAIEDQRDEAAEAQRELAQGSDPAFAGAVKALAEALGREDIAALVAQARVTQTGEDDTIVQQIDDARGRAREEEGETAEQKARLKTLAARRRELEDIQYEFKKQGFDNPRSTFREDKLVGDLLTDFLRGGMTAATYWDHWQRSQHWQGGVRRDARRGPGPLDGGFQWPDSSFGSGGNGGFAPPRPGGFGGSWGRLPGTGGGGLGNRGSGGGSFTRPRSGSTAGGGGFRTGGRV